jgi:transcriptional regulator NrdR family protein
VGAPHPGQVTELVESVIAEARSRAADGTIDSEVLSAIVLDKLKDFDPVTHVRFALVSLGRLDQPAATGWRDVEDVRAWLLHAYPDLRHSRPSIKLTTVVKRDWRRQPYDRGKLERSIALSSKGRGPSSDKVRALATRIADSVEAELGSQALVTSGQIAAEILRYLRRRDHVAGLRFASTAKRFVSVEDYESEALGLRQRRG